MSSPDNPQQGNSRVQRGNKPRPRGGGSGCGCFLLLLLILIALGGGGYYLYKNGQLNLSSLSSLNLPNIPGLNTSQDNSDSYGDYGTEPTNNQNEGYGSLSQSEPFKPPNQQAQQQNQQSSQRSKASTRSQNKRKLYKSQDGKTYVKRVRRVSPRRHHQMASRRKSRHSLTKQYSKNKAPRTIHNRKTLKNPNKIINYKAFNPSKGIVTGSLESLVASRKLNPFNLAVKPSQIITFQSPFYKYEEALNEYTQKLTKLGFKKISIPINDYNIGGSTVLLAYDKEGNHVYISFKPIKEWRLTSWRIEVYKSYKK